MIQTETKLQSADNSGAKIVQCIKVLGGSRRRYAGIGDIIVVAVQEASPRAQVKKKEVHKAVVVRQKKALRRKDGSYIRFDDNSVVLIEGFEPKATRLFGPMPYELRQKFPKIISMASEIL